MKNFSLLFLLLLSCGDFLFAQPGVAECAELVRRADNYFVQKLYKEAKAEYEKALNCPGEKAYAEKQLQAISSEKAVAPGVSDTTVTLNIPSSFNPNGELVDYWAIEYKGPPIEEFELTIYDRWGNVIQKSTNPKARWQGMNQHDKPVASGTYYYIISLKPFGASKKSYTGFVTLIR